MVASPFKYCGIFISKHFSDHGSRMLYSLSDVFKVKMPLSLGAQIGLRNAIPSSMYILRCSMMIGMLLRKIFFVPFK